MLKAMEKKDPRFSFELENLGLGPLSLGKAKFNSRTNTVGSAPRSLNIQTRVPWMKTEKHPRYGSVDVLGGTDRIGSVGTDELGAAEGDILFRQDINPGSFLGTRMAKWNPQYQRFRFRKLNILYEAAAGTQTVGQLIGYYDSDVDKPLASDSPSNANVAASQVGNQICQIWEDQVFPFGEMDPFTTLFTQIGLVPTVDERLHLQAIFYLLAGTNLAPNLDMGVLYLDYELEFFIPALSADETPLKEAWSLGIEGSSSGITKTIPFGSSASASELPIPGLLALNNIEFNYTAADGTFAFTNIPPGQYDVIATQVLPGGPYQAATGTGPALGNFQFLGEIGCAGSAFTGGPYVNDASVSVDQLCGVAGLTVNATDGQCSFRCNLLAFSGFEIHVGAPYDPPSPFVLFIRSTSDRLAVVLTRPSRYLAKGKDWMRKSRSAAIEGARKSAAETITNKTQSEPKESELQATFSSVGPSKGKEETTYSVPGGLSVRSFVAEAAGSPAVSSTDVRYGRPLSHGIFHS
jgi:hypothetical protein